MRKRTALTLAALAGGGLAARTLAQDETLALLSEGYGFIPERCRRNRSDIFETRLMLTRVVCMAGEEAAEVFYEPDRFTRNGALPQMTLRLLQDQGSVAVLDDEAHRQRKRMFMSLMNPASRERLADEVEARWRERLVKWETMEEVVLHDEAREILCRAVCGWAGVPLAESEVEQRTREFAAMIEGAGTFGPRNWLGLLLRRRTEGWIQEVVEKVRTGELDVPEESAAHVIAWHRDPDGELLDSEVAVVELLNLLRPTVAVAWYVTFAALALRDYPACRQKLRTGEDGYDELFVQEVRRFYPFFPFVGGRVRDAFTWRRRRFAEGAWVLLDLYGTNHDARIWGDPEEFRPERFRDWDGSAYDFIPQGGGDHHEGHRCAGEWITIRLMKVAVRLLTQSIRYNVPEQDLRVRLSRMPAVPESRFVISGVRRTGE